MCFLSLSPSLIGKQKSSLSREAIVNAQLIISIARMMDKMGGFNIEKNSVPSFKI